MGAVKAVELAGIIYSTFENVRGSVIGCQYPKNYLSHEKFKKITHTVIPRTDLTNQPITIEEFGHFIIGFPQRIEGIQYTRNTLLFNLCFLIRPQSRMISHNDDLTGRHFCLDSNSAGLRPAIQGAYELTVRKINRYLAYMEEEFLILSSKQVNENDGGLLDSFLAQIWFDLRERGLSVATLGPNLPPLYLIFSPRTVNTSVTSYFVPGVDELVDASASFSGMKTASSSGGAMNIWSRAPALPVAAHEVTDASVFVRIEPIGAGPCGSQMVYALDASGSFWDADCDLTSQRILPMVNGQLSVAELSRLAVVDVNIARLCLTQLAQVGAVRAVSAPIFAHNHHQRTNRSVEEAEVEGVEVFDEENLLFSVPGYIGLPRLLELTHSNPTLRDACLQSVLLPCSKINICTNDQAIKVIFAILRVYSKLCSSYYLNLPHLIAATFHFAELITPHNPLTKDGYSQAHMLPQIDLLRLVQFGEVNNLIQRLRCFPICNDSKEELPHTPSFSTAGVFTTPHTNRALQKLVLPHHDSLENSMDLGHLQSSLWSLAQSQLMDGVSSIDQMVFALSSHALRNIQDLNACNFNNSHHNSHSQHHLRGQEWTPSRFSTLPDAVVAFTTRLFSEKKNEEIDQENSVTSSISDASILYSDMSSTSIANQRCASDNLQHDVDLLIPKIYTLWH